MWETGGLSDKTESLRVSYFLDSKNWTVCWLNVSKSLSEETGVKEVVTEGVWDTGRFRSGIR